MRGVGFMSKQLAMPVSEKQEVHAQTAYIAKNGDQYFGNVKNEYNFHSPHKPNPPRNSSSCNIIVLKEQAYSNSGFLTIEHKYVSLNGNSLTDITEYPAIFMNPNNGFGQCVDESQTFHYGQITVASKKSNLYEILYITKPTIELSQKKLSSIAEEIGINIADGKDILDLTGWTVRPINIKDALENRGFDLRDVNDY